MNEDDYNFLGSFSGPEKLNQPPCIMSVQCTEGSSLNHGDIIEYTLWVFSTPGDTLSTPGSVKYTGKIP